MRFVLALAMMAAAADCLASPAGPHLFNGRPASNPASWISAQDLAGQAFSPRGRVGFTLTVSPEGTAQACRVHDSSGDARTDALTCDLMLARARFEPAHDRAGTPVATTYSSAMTWTRDDRPRTRPQGFEVDAVVESLPEGVPAPARFVGEILVDDTGRIVDCDGEDQAPAALEAQACKILMENHRADPLLDAGGKPQKGIMGVVVSLQVATK